MKKNILLKTLIICFSFLLLFVCFNDVKAKENKIARKNLSDAFKVDKGDPLKGSLDKTNYKVVSGENALNPIFSAMINTGLILLGTLFLVLMIYGGFLWMSDQGNEEQVTKAKKLIQAAITGLVIVLSAYAITFFLLNILGSQTLDETGLGSTTVENN